MQNNVNYNYLTNIVLDFLHYIWSQRREGKIKLTSRILIFYAALFLCGIIAVIIFSGSLTKMTDKIEFYTSQKGLDSYSYLEGSFTYLIIIPLVVDGFLLMKKSIYTERFKVPLYLTLCLLLMSLMIPVSYGIDRVITSLFFLLYLVRISIGNLWFEYRIVPLRFAALILYLVTRSN